MEWVRHWRVEIVREDPCSSSTRTRTDIRFAATPATLRVMVMWARGNRCVTRCTVASLRVLDGQMPEHCRCGTRYVTWGSLSTLDWKVCVCGGHFELACRQCGRVTVEPVPVFDCDAWSEPAPGTGRAGDAMM